MGCSCRPPVERAGVDTCPARHRSRSSVPLHRNNPVRRHDDRTGWPQHSNPNRQEQNGQGKQLKCPRGSVDRHRQNPIRAQQRWPCDRTFAVLARRSGSGASGVSYPGDSIGAMDFLPDDEQARVLEHDRSAMLVAGEPGTGKSAVLRERFARLIEAGADPERVVLVVRTKRAKAEARAHLFDRLRASLPGLKVLTVYGLAHHVLTRRFAALDYESPPGVLTAADQFLKVRDLLGAEDPSDWPAYGPMLGLRGFADEVRQFLLRAQEALIEPEEVERTAAESEPSGWDELAAFYRTYLDVLGSEEVVDFAGLVAQAGVAAARDGEPLFDHVLVDDYQDGTFASERLVLALGGRAGSLVVAGHAGSHAFSFQGTTVRPLERFPESMAGVTTVRLATPHRSPGLATEAW